MSFEGSKAVMIKDVSGNVLAVPGGGISATANVSGQPITLTNASGFNAIYVTNQSGNLALSVIPGNGISDALSLATSNMTLVASELLGFDSVGSTWGRLRTTASGSVASQGAGLNRLFVDTTEGGVTVRPNTPVAVISNSGGSSLGSGHTPYGIKIKHLTSGEGNAISGMVWVGGSGTGLAPFSGTGYPLSLGETLELKAHNFNSVRIVAAVSGSLISAIGVSF